MHSYIIIRMCHGKILPQTIISLIPASVSASLLLNPMLQVIVIRTVMKQVMMYVAVVGSHLRVAVDIQNFFDGLLSSPIIPHLSPVLTASDTVESSRSEDFFLFHAYF